MKSWIGFALIAMVISMLGCEPRDDSWHGNWHVWYAQKGVLEEFYNHGGNWSCGMVEGVRAIRATTDETQWWASLWKPNDDGQGNYKFLAMEESREAAEHRVETSLQCSK